ncbi:efflux transporter periplasmic adaptor subunit [Achromobacter sp. HZ28]|nr:MULTISPECIES: efflux RND transporter periplasmic adaptor subunit [unclassified Achromobacter]OWT74812.1 efflux transporter periplasmic adaptor subunit [Achromobacter sp. HZ34]OWT79726.1 efflux transporter periplasmic adaptor subunit [Achromobacter sp. HZ28]
MAKSSIQRRVGITTGIVALAGLSAAFWGIDHNAAADTPAAAAPPVMVTSTAVKRADVPIYLTGVGTVTPNQSVTIKARVDGQLDKVAFTEGQDVAAGQLLAQIDPRTLQAQLAQAQALQAKDQAQLANANLDLQRYTRLSKEDATTQQTLDTQRALVAQLDAAVKTDAAQVAYAKVQLSFTTISAPISGRTGARLVDQGNIVHATDTTGLVVINQIDPISVVFTVPEAHVPDLNQAAAHDQHGLPVTALRRDSEQVLGKGKLVLVNNQIDTTSGTVQLKASFPNPEHLLWPGQYVNARVRLGTHTGALTVPAPAVQRGQTGTYVYVIDEHTVARMQPVHVALIQDGMAVIDKGLAAGQRVVVDGQYKLKPGARTVESKPAAAPAARRTEASEVALNSGRAVTQAAARDETVEVAISPATQGAGA